MSASVSSIARHATRQVRVGDALIGGGAPVLVQSMTNTDTADAGATAQQVADSGYRPTILLGVARGGLLPAATLAWWLGSVAVFGAGVALFDGAVYGGPLETGYRHPGEIRFALNAVLPNLRYMPTHLIQAMPMLVLALAALVWIAWRWLRLHRPGGVPAT